MRPPPNHQPSFGVRLPDVDSQELDLIVILLVKVVETHGPADIRRSGKAAEDQSHWFAVAKIGQADWILPVEIVELKIRCRVPGFRSAGVVFVLPGSLFFDEMNRVGHGFTLLSSM